MANDLPGNTQLPPEEYLSVSLPSLLPPSCPSCSSCSSCPSRPSKPIILFASNDVSDNVLSVNGLTQNILILYDLFESMGWSSYLLQHQKSHLEKHSFLSSYRTLTPQEVITQPMRIRIFIEIGSSIDPVTRKHLRSLGTKLVKLYLGNILNIDVETIQYYPSIFFHHHIVGEIDEIWTSPHYAQHQDYAAILNRTDPEQSRIAPYVWDPCFMTHYGTKTVTQWKPPKDWRTQDIVIMEPSISFQKCAFYSLLLAEAYSKAHPEWRGNVHVVNGDRLSLSTYAQNRVLPYLTLYQTKRLHLYGRKRLPDVLEEYPSACFLAHQLSNEYNYMTLEIMYCQFPILHNATGWSPYGYYYSVDEWEKAIETLHTVLTRHKENLAIYKTHMAQLQWKHSIHHPEIRRRWAELAELADSSNSNTE
jgi:hypothetical protein